MHTDKRKRDLVLIHVAKRQLQLDDATYRALLRRVAGVDSAAKASATGRARILAEFERLGWTPRRKHRPRPSNDREFMCRKIRAMLMEAERPDSYADSMAKRMFGVERFEWLPPQQLRRLLVALVYDQRRRQRKES